MYSAQAQYVRQDDYNDFGPGPMVSPKQGGARVTFQDGGGRGGYSDGRGGYQDGGESPRSPPSNYANIRINVAPPTPTNKEFDYGR
jgi:hypothetical protein